MHATQEPADSDSDTNSRIGLGLNEFPQCDFE